MAEVGITDPPRLSTVCPDSAHTLPELLDGISLFSNVTDLDFALLSGSLIERRFTKGTVILEEGLPGDHMYFIREGRVKVTMASGDGRERIASLLQAGDFFGDMALIDLRPRSASATALEATTVLAISRSTFLRLLRGSPELSLGIIRDLVDRLRQADEKVTALCFLGVKDRTRRAIEELAPSGGEPGLSAWSPPVTHQQLADLVGSSRETVTRALQELKRDGAVHQRGKRYRRAFSG